MQKKQEVDRFEYRCRVCGALIDQLELVMYSCVCQDCVDAADMSMDGV